MRIVSLSVLAALMAAQPAAAQDFLGGLARRAAEAAAARAVGAMIGGQTAPASQPSTPAQPATPASATRRGQPAAAPGPYSALHALPEPEREAACNQRVPLNADGGRDYAAQIEFGACMGPRWGEGG